MTIVAMVLAVALHGTASGPAVNPCVRPAAPRSAVTLRPVDQAAMQPDFFTFRARLQTAIAARDDAALLAAVDPAIQLSFGGDDGIEELKKQLRDPKGTMWADLGAALALGGTFSSATTFTAPYVFAAWPDGVDSFECVAVLGDRVRVRQTLAADSAVVGTASMKSCSESRWTVTSPCACGWRAASPASSRRRSCAAPSIAGRSSNGSAAVG